MSLPMTRRNLRNALVELGWTGQDVTADLKAFQTGYAHGRVALRPDGVNGPLTREAVRQSLRLHRAGQPDASLFFRWAEFRCRCGGALPGCRTILVTRALLLAADQYRHAVGGPVDVVSGYRCPERNRRVGGATSSQHLYGAACDVKPVLTVARVRGLRRFSGIGRSRKLGKVRHLDVRHLAGHNSTGGTVDRPTVWDYAA